MEKGMRTLESQPAIWVIGNSVLMEGVVACLQERKARNRLRYDVCQTQLDANLHASKPTLVIFELDAPGSSSLFEWLREQPGLHLLGIDQNCNQVIVLNSFSRETRTMSDLYQVIDEISGSWE